MRTLRLLALLLILVLASAWGYAWTTRTPGENLGQAFARLAARLGSQQPPSLGGIQLPGGAALGGPFQLTDHTGRTVTEADYAGRFVLAYFGFTYCPDVCPTELGTLSAAIDVLGERGAAVVPVFITVDPERDTPEHLADYVARFHPRLQGLSGTPAQVAAVARRYRVYYAKAPQGEHTGYLMDHSSFIYLIGPDARVRALFRPETSPEAIGAAVAAQLGGGA